MPRYCFFSPNSGSVSNEQSCLKTTGLYDDLLLLSSLFHFFYFIFSAPISFSLCFPISPSLFKNVLSQAFKSNVVEKLLCWSSNILVIWCKQTTHWKSPWCWERLRAEGEEGVRGWDGWMAFPVQWTWTWASEDGEG